MNTYKTGQKTAIRKALQVLINYRHSVSEIKIVYTVLFALINNVSSMKMFHQISDSCSHPCDSMVRSAVQFKIIFPNISELMSSCVLICLFNIP